MLNGDVVDRPVSLGAETLEWMIPDRGTMRLTELTGSIGRSTVEDMDICQFLATGNAVNHVDLFVQGEDDHRNRDDVLICHVRSGKSRISFSNGTTEMPDDHGQRGPARQD